MPARGWHTLLKSVDGQDVREDLKGLGCGWHAWQTKRCDGLWVGRYLGPVMGESQRP